MSISFPKIEFRGLIAEQKQQLTNFFFQTEDLVRRVLEVFGNSLLFQSGNVGINKSTNGVTGATYMCQLDAFDIDATIECDLALEFVLKWQPDRLCRAEILGEEIFRQLGFSTAATYYIPQETANRIVASAKKHSENIESLTNNHPTLAMQKLQAGNLQAYLKNGRIKRLSLEDKKTLIKTFGRIAAVDLLIANNDRFIRFNPDQKEIFPPKTDLNSGNILLKIDENPEDKEGRTFLKGIFPIDNCPSISLIEKEYEDIQDYDLGGMWGDEDEWETPSQSGEESLPESKTPLPERSEPIIREKIEGFNKSFEFIINNVNLICEQFTENFKNEILSLDLDLLDYQDIVNVSHEAFREGVEEEIQRIRDSAQNVFTTIHHAHFDINLPVLLIGRNLNTLLENK